MYRELSLDEFRFNTGIRNSHLPAEGTIISLRELARIAKVEVMMSMEEKYLKQMLRSVVLKGNHRHRLYEAAEIKVEAVPPFAFPVIQTFIQRSKYQDFLEKFSLVFQGFYSHGFSQQLPVVVIGQDEEGQTLIAHYLPPIVEECAGVWHLPDGIHRCFLAGSVGTTIEAIVIKGVTAPPRAKLLQWSDLRCVDEKPPMAERSVNNNPDLYRLWENVGIDG